MSQRNHSHRETPVKRSNPSGKTVWVARYTDREGKYKSNGTFKREWEAQEAIDTAYEREYGGPAGAPHTFGEYAQTWPLRRPRRPRTNVTNNSRLRAVLDVPIEGRPLRDWPLRELRKRHGVDLLGHLLTHQGRAHTGAQNVLRVVSALCEDAITDEVAYLNFVRGVRVQAGDPRVTGKTRPPRLFGFEQMHTFAACGGRWEPCLRVFTDCGLRLGEVLSLESRDFDGEAFHTRGSAHNGEFIVGDAPTKKHVRSVPCPPSTTALVAAMPRRIDTPLLFPTASGTIFHESNFRKQVWTPALVAYLGVERAKGETARQFRARCRVELADNERGIRPHDCRHSWESHLRAAGIDDANLADIAGHSVATMLGHYTHALKRSHDQVRRLIG